MAEDCPDDPVTALAVPMLSCPPLLVGSMVMPMVPGLLAAKASVMVALAGLFYLLISCWRWLGRALRSYQCRR